MSIYNKEDIEAKLRNFISHFFRKRDIENDENIYELGFVNSLFAMQLVMFVEKEFEIEIDNTELDFSIFSTINSMCDFISAKLK